MVYIENARGITYVNSKFIGKEDTFLVQEIFQLVRPPNFEWFSKFLLSINFDIGHQVELEENNHLQMICSL